MEMNIVECMYGLMGSSHPFRSFPVFFPKNKEYNRRYCEQGGLKQWKGIVNRRTNCSVSRKEKEMLSVDQHRIMCLL
ncbi:hypothetical protein MPTK1_2g04770 [Marchantia polymorpha subsp. ruderalis]|uniref:Uncharacterized protein n=1 Tax=Marchantia polymorpha TaxID=3197 RepID=A0A2R6X7S9_MARPO|nr:hypothetical protein MARPO_0031s0132 [Marchantia polymorpha]BBN01116.1 hypothetical protein Mp_2g04770 [Marchantia polymorpha subsp. ruderalis]|eukprot:PTQ42165.1 hypothetical protein MARPO_0031s0132 [Marchantia polymorpha]